ncbi:Uncharacterised protein [Mycobacteroides abscessus subsp. abscessus]|nr:Uncharacterised protein [Mycobacteroides abscessus subsp. abscessus]
MLLVANRDEEHARGLEQVSGDEQPAFQERQPLRRLRTVVLVDVTVVVDPPLVAGVVWRVDVDQVDLFAVGGPQRLQGVEILSVYH